VTDATSGVHRLEALVNVIQVAGGADKLVDVQLARLPVGNKARELRSSLDAAERASHPNSSSDQLERSRRDFLTSSSNTNDDGFAPSLVA